MIHRNIEFSASLPSMINYMCLVVFVIHGYILILVTSFNLVLTHAYFLVTPIIKEPTNSLILKHTESIYLDMLILLSMFFHFLVPFPMSPFQQKKHSTIGFLIYWPPQLILWLHNQNPVRVFLPMWHLLLIFLPHWIRWELLHRGHVWHNSCCRFKIFFFTCIFSFTRFITCP